MSNRMNEVEVGQVVVSESGEEFEVRRLEREFVFLRNERSVELRLSWEQVESFSSVEV